MKRFCRPTVCFGDDEEILVRSMFRTGWISNGIHVERLERHFQEHYDVKYAIACSSCTQGLVIALQAAEWRGMHIALPVYTWPSTEYAIMLTGNTPVYCDINHDSWLINGIPDCDAVVPVDLFGNNSFGRTTKPTIYDAAHSYGIQGLGHRGLVEVISFSTTKLVTGIEGGMILTNNGNIAETAKNLRRLSSRMPEPNAVIALQSIDDFKKNKMERYNIIEKYKKLILIDYTDQAIPIMSNNSVYAITVDCNERREKIVHRMKQNGYEVKLYHQPLKSGFPNADDIYSRILCLPVYPGMIDDVDEVCRCINEA